jgi:hypothetical protein
MARRLLAAIARTYGVHRDETPHIHMGEHGPYVCHDPRCTSPSL